MRLIEQPLERIGDGTGVLTFDTVENVDVIDSQNLSLRHYEEMGKLSLIQCSSSFQATLVFNKIFNSCADQLRRGKTKNAKL